MTDSSKWYPGSAPLSIKKHQKEINTRNRNDNILQKNTIKDNQDIKLANALIGFLFYVVFIVIIIPFILLKFKFYKILECYVPNVDLIANVLTWWEGPFDLFKYLYKQIPTSFFALFTQTFINYLALLGLTYIVIKKSVQNKNIYAGWGRAFVMLIVTYLVPSRIVSEIMRQLTLFIENDGIVAILGMITNIAIIIFESVILKNYDKFLEKNSRLFIDTVKKMAK